MRPGFVASSTTSPSPLAITNPAGDSPITFLNRQFTTTFGYTLADIPTVHDWAQLAYPDEDYRRATFQFWDAAVEEATRTHGTIEPKEFRVYCRDGTCRDVLINAVALEDMLLVGFIDITERKHTEEREKQLEAHHRRDLETKLKTSLSASAIAHEINQPLSTILLQSNLALQRGDDAREALRVIAEEARRVVVTIDKMKTLLRNVQTRHRPIHLSDVVLSTLLYNKSMLTRLDIEWQTAGLDHPGTILGDDAQLQLALTNLLRNAAEAITETRSPLREIRIELREHRDIVELIIGDSGPGWNGAEPAETPLNTTKQSGSGIGLYVVRTAMENHRGSIQFGPSPLGGAEVRLRFARKHE